MGPPKLGTPSLHIPSDMETVGLGGGGGGGGGGISLGIWGPGIPRTLVIWGSFDGLGTQGLCSIHILWFGIWAA